MSKEKSIVFINQNSGYLMIDIIRAHENLYDSRSLITGRLIERGTALDDSVKLVKIIPYNRSSWRRIYTWVVGFIQILFFVKTKFRKADLYIISNPPLATLLPLFCRNRFFLLIFDVYPDALVEYRVFKANSLPIRWWRRANEKIFARAERIFTLSNGMKRLLSRYVPDDKIVVSPVWTDNSFLKPIPKENNPFILNHSLQDGFLVVYSGNLGLTHELEVLVECSKLVKNPRVTFVIIGEGDKRRLLEEQVGKLGLRNWKFFPWQPASMLPYSLAAADLGVVSLAKEASLLSVPSKTYNLMSVGVPLLCIASAESELAELVGKYELGQCFEAGDAARMAGYIERLASDRYYYDQFCKRALAASRDFGVENATKLVARS